MKLMKRKSKRSRLLFKIALQEQQIAEMKLYISEMKKMLLERRGLSIGYGND